MSTNMDDTVTTKLLLWTVLKKCKFECMIPNPQALTSDYIGRACYFTGVDRSDMIELSKEEDEFVCKDLKKIKLVIQVLQCMSTLYAKQVCVQYNDVYKEFCVRSPVSKDKNISFYSFCSLLVSMGFNRHLKCSPSYVLIEDPKVTFDRYHYLNSISKCRAKRNTIFYIDEVIIDYNRVIQKKDEKSELFTLLHIISNLGFCEGLFYFEPTSDDLHKWIQHMILPNLPPKSVIVLPTNPLHSQVKNRISEFSSKQEMTNWLKEKQIPFCDEMRKAELFKLIQKTQYQLEEFVLDHMLKSFGHKVLRIPDGIKHLTPITFLWDYFEKHFMPSAPRDTPNHRNEVLIFIRNTLRDKHYFNKDVILMENHLMEIDTNIEKSLEKYTVVD